MRPNIFHAAALATMLLAVADSQAQQSGITQENGITSFDPESATPGEIPAVDFGAAQALALRTAEEWSEDIANAELVRALASPETTLVPQLGIPDVRVGREGNGKVKDVNIEEPEFIPPEAEQDAVASVDFGLAFLPFTTAQADIPGLRINERLPYRPTGKLFFVDGGRSFICSGSMVEKGLVVTAAHCVSEFGRERFFANWSFVPGYRNTVAPFDTWSAQRVYVMSSYLDGTDNCHSENPGIVCENDVAIIVLQPKTENGLTDYAGDRTGWYSVGWDMVGFTPSGATHITQLGYPFCLDQGRIMERNDSLANISPEFTGNSVFGSLMCGGSSGGPILINFGAQPELSGTVTGQSPSRNVVIGVTSWGSTNSLIKRMGASPFRSTNVKVLIEQACSDFPDACE